MRSDRSLASIVTGSACLRQYGPAITLYLGVTAVTQAWFMADTNDYVLEIQQYTTGGTDKFWEFGHLLWRPLGFAAFHLSRPFFEPIAGNDPLTSLWISLIALNWLAGLASVWLMQALALRVCAAAWAAHFATAAFILTHGFLNYAQTGASYIPGLALLLAAFYILSKPDAPLGRAALGWLWAGLALAGSLSLWATYLWAVPAVLLSPFFWFGINRQRQLLVLRTTIVFGLATGVIFLTGAFNGGVRDLAGLQQWIAGASHGIASAKGLPSVAFGLARSLIHLGNDGLVFKRFLLHDPFNPVSLFDLFGVTLLKLALFYLFVALLLLNLLRTTEGRSVFQLWMLNAVPVLLFGFFWHGGDMERYLALYPLTFTALGYLLGRKQAWGAFRWVATIFIGVMSYANLATMTIPALEHRQKAVIARITDLKAEAKPKSLVVTPYFQDELVNFSLSFPFHPINQQTDWRLIDLVSPLGMEAPRWRERFVTEALLAWQGGGEVWLAKRALAPHPRADWLWVEGTDPNVSWTDFPKFFSQIDTGRSVGGEDGFVLVPLSPNNESYLRSLSVGAELSRAETNRQ